MSNTKTEAQRLAEFKDLEFWLQPAGVGLTGWVESVCAEMLRLDAALDTELANRDVLDQMLTQCIAERDQLRAQLVARQEREEVSQMKTITFDETKWKLVPVEPTQEMVMAGIHVLPNETTPAHWWISFPKEAYQAMLAATPSQPAVPQDMRMVPASLLEELESSLYEFGQGRCFTSIDMDRYKRLGEVLSATPAAPDATQSQLVTLTDERLREIDDAHNWQTTEGRMAAYKTIIADLKANAIRARSKE